MVKIFLTVLFFINWGNCFSQGFIGDKYAKVLKGLAKDTANTHLRSNISFTDSTISYLVRDSSVRPVDIQLHFDKKGKCDRESWAFTCDSCFQQRLTKHVLGKTRYNWKKVNDSTYFSNPYWDMVLTFPIGAPFSYIIQKTDISYKQFKTIPKADAKKIVSEQ